MRYRDDLSEIILTNWFCYEFFDGGNKLFKSFTILSNSDLASATVAYNAVSVLDPKKEYVPENV